jgi:hypothetical protein
MNELLRLNPFWIIFDNQMNRAFDQYVYFWVELYFLPYRMMGATA